MKFHIKTLGCRVNQYESQFMKELLVSNGFQETGRFEEADIVVINSCTVTAESDRKTRQFVHKAKALNPNSIVILCGCMPQAMAASQANFKYADIVLGNRNRKDLLKYIVRFMENRQGIVDIKEHKTDDTYEDILISSFSGRTRAYMKIQDGCNNFCSYCLIPYARGRERSRKLSDIKNEAEQLAQVGYKEIILTGINLSAYGKEFDLNLCDAIEVLEKIEGIHRIRLSSLEPDFLNSQIIHRMSKCKKLCNHFHLCLQSGCDATLKRMNRHYDTEKYRQLVQELRNKFKNCSISTDILLGFPGETEDEFNKTLDFVREIELSKAHVFPFSVREGTKASIMENQIAKGIKKERCKVIADVVNEQSEKFLHSQIDKKLYVLFEGLERENMYIGFSENYLAVKVFSKQDICGKILPVAVKACDSETLFGEVCRDKAMSG